MRKVPTPPIDRQSLSDQVYDRLLRELCDGHFHCGQELNEVVLARQYQVSRTPIRDALQRLSAERLVVNARNRRATVISPSPREVEEMYHVRRLLESEAARLAAPRMTAPRLARLRQSEEEAVPQPGESWGRPELRFDRELHRAIADACGNSRLQDEIERYGRIVRFVRSQVARDPSVLEAGHEQHLKVLAALEAKDGQAAAAAMDDHITAALESVLAGLDRGFVGPDAATRA